MFDPRLDPREDGTGGGPPCTRRPACHERSANNSSCSPHVTGVSEEEHLRLAVRDYLESAGRDAEVAAFVDRARGRLRRVLDRLGDL